MQRTPKVWPRRQFLVGATTMLALPWLASALPRRARAAAASPALAGAAIQRLVVVHLPCGLAINSWTPTTVGANFTLSPSLSPLAPLQKNVLVLSNMQHDAAQRSPQKPGQGLHARGLGTLFTGANLKLDVGRPLAATSMDQLFAQSAGVSGATGVASLQLGLSVAQNDCDANYNCQDMESISWSDANTPIVDQTDPQQVFDKYFANLGNAQNLAAANYQRAMRKSVLDNVLEQATSLQAKLNADDTRKLDQYLTGVRALETQFASTNAAVCKPGTRPAKGGKLDAQAAAMMDLMVLAFQCDLTRTLSFNFGAGHSNHYYNFLPGITDTHHSLSHHQNRADIIAQLAKIDQWHVSMLARFWSGLAALPEGEGTVLDNHVSLVTSELADGNAHNYTNAGVLLVGGGKFMTPGRHVRAGANGVYGNLTEVQLAVLQGLGTNITSFGDFKVSRAMTLTA